MEGGLDTAVNEDTLARTVWGEARGEGMAGMYAVAHVVRNRAKMGLERWGTDIVAVCKKPFQFSCWNVDPDPNSNYAAMMAVSASNPSFARALEVASNVLATNDPDPTNGADSYFNPDEASPDWAEDLEPVAVIGHHEFYITAWSP